MRADRPQAADDRQVVCMEKTEFGFKDAGLILLQAVDERDLASIEEEYAYIREMTKEEVLLRTYTVSDWNRQLSPWRAPAVFGKEDFGGGAAETLSEILRDCRDPEAIYCIGGYSLAGLFALWSACRAELFAGVAAASPSVWFPGFTDYLRKERMHSGYVYLSLGDREDRTKNPVMRTVKERIEETRDILTGQEIPCLLEWNPGNHFQDAEKRTAAAFARTIEYLKR